MSLLEIDRCDWCYAVAGGHPLASIEGPVGVDDIRRFRGVIVRDSSRHLPPQSRRVFDAQPVMRVQTLEQKIAAQVSGLGAGYLPRRRITDDLDSGELVAQDVLDPEPPAALFLVWRKGARGKAMRWLLAQLQGATKVEK